MKKIIVPGLILYCIASGLGLFLHPNPSGLYLALWLTGYMSLALVVAYESFLSRERLNFFPFIVLGIIQLNFFVQITGGAQSSLWPVYFLFTVCLLYTSPSPRD